MPTTHRRTTPNNGVFSLLPWLTLTLLACVAPGSALGEPSIDGQQSEGSEAQDTHAGDTSDVTRPTPANDQTRPLLTATQAMELSLDACVTLLQEAGVAVERLDPEDNDGVQMPVRVTSPIDGVTVALRGHDQIHNVLDCRLGAALLAWAPTLRAQGITRLEHYSIYRPGARTGRRKRSVSGHARGLAIDAARFYFSDGRMLDVLDDWGAHERGADPCIGDTSDDDDDRILRELVCDAVARDLFTVVLTPHHDKAHENHVHLELVPDVTWTYVR